MPKKTRKNHSPRTAFENSKDASGEWLQDPPLVCEAVRMQPEPDPWEKKGKVVRQESATEKRRKKHSELSLNIEHFISDESGAAVA
jgi:hypothetical protein